MPGTCPRLTDHAAARRHASLQEIGAEFDPRPPRPPSPRGRRRRNPRISRRSPQVSDRKVHVGWNPLWLLVAVRQFEEIDVPQGASLAKLLRSFGRRPTPPSASRWPATRARQGDGWRRGRDSNPRYGFPYTHFPGVRLRPLGHPSASRLRCGGASVAHSAAAAQAQAQRATRNAWTDRPGLR